MGQKHWFDAKMGHFGAKPTFTLLFGTYNMRGIMRTSSKISQNTPNTTLIHPKPTLYTPYTHHPLYNLAKITNWGQMGHNGAKPTFTLLVNSYNMRDIIHTSSEISEYTPNTTPIHPIPTIYPPYTHQPLHKLAKIGNCAVMACSVHFGDCLCAVQSQNVQKVAYGPYHSLRGLYLHLQPQS